MSQCSSFPQKMQLVPWAVGFLKYSVSPQHNTKRTLLSLRVCSISLDQDQLEGDSRFIQVLSYPKNTRNFSWRI